MYFTLFPCASLNQLNVGKDMTTFWSQISGNKKRMAPVLHQLIFPEENEANPLRIWYWQASIWITNVKRQPEWMLSKILLKFGNFLENTHKRDRVLDTQHRLVRIQLNKHLTYLASLYLRGHGTRPWVTASGRFLSMTTRAEMAHKDIWGYVILVSGRRVSCHIKPPAPRRNRQHRRDLSPGGKCWASLQSSFFLLSADIMWFAQEESDGEDSPGLSFSHQSE